MALSGGNRTERLDVTTREKNKEKRIKKIL